MNTENVETLKSLIRPYLIISGWTTWLYLIIIGITVPFTLAAVIGAVTGEYFIERGYKRFKETK